MGVPILIWRILNTILYYKKSKKKKKNDRNISVDLYNTGLKKIVNLQSSVHGFAREIRINYECFYFKVYYYYLNYDTYSAQVLINFHLPLLFLWG